MCFRHPHLLVKRRRARVTKAAGGFMVISTVLTALGQPVLAVAAVVLVLLVGAVCWIVADPGRARSLAMLICVTLGGDRRLPPQ